VGGALPGLNDVERQYFDVAKEVFQEVDAGPDGLGPRFNLDSCSGAFPAYDRRHESGHKSTSSGRDLDGREERRATIRHGQRADP